MSEYVKFKKFSELPELTEPLEPIGVYLKTFLQKEQEGYNTFDAAFCGIWAASEYERRTKMKDFKEDDMVRVLDYSDHANWVDEMDHYIGQILTIVKKIDGPIVRYHGEKYYKVKENSWNWNQDWLVPVNFTKDDIREFDVVEFRDGRMFLVVDLGDELRTARNYVDDYSDDLTMNFLGHHYELEDIMKVYRPKDNLPTDKSKWKDLPLIWERKEVKEMTVDEISKALGYKVKVVGEEV